MNDKIEQAVFELANIQTLLEQLDIKSSRHNITNMMAIQNSINNVIRVLTAPEPEPEKGDVTDGTAVQKGK